ncbi:hypothetical protein EJ06DRAFT_390935 [Trichodelitschia bisporula]|uniref:Uncharacterized protein n=1 Tax=Trichodelitschia bisporula TaxID=703511 RepID=A0A6G1HZV9_9PEZI|nr:hypothetical protein EJ06DRAFT_390935 [Trichodelitschia bisporula]
MAIACLRRSIGGHALWGLFCYHGTIGGIPDSKHVRCLGTFVLSLAADTRPLFSLSRVSSTEYTVHTISLDLGRG